MDITSENFEKTYPTLLSELDQCDFMSLDCELTGITNYKELNYLDTPNFRYEKLKNNDSGFLIIQFGICFFRKLPNKSYHTDAYNIYVYPKSEKAKYTKQVNFMCQNTSIEFLIQNNFDFNKLFKSGVSYLSKMEEEQIRFSLNNTNSKADNLSDSLTDDILVPSKSTDIRDQLVEFMKQIDEFYANEEEKIKEFTYPELPFILRIYMEKNLKKKYANSYKFVYKQDEKKEFLITITKKEKSEILSDMEILENEIGFSKLLWQISKSSKLIVGHNMITDIMQIIRLFFYSPLPDSLEEFKRVTHSIFPKLLDTKYMANLAPLKELITNTALGEMHKILCKEPFKSVEIENCKYNKEDEKLHEAGYDAFLTGCCFINMLNYLQSTMPNNQDKILDLYTNKIFLMKMYDVSFIDMCNEQAEPNRENVLFMEFYKKMDTKSVFDIFASFGQIFVSWIDDFSALVHLKEEKYFKKAVEQLVGVPGNDYKIFFYKTYLSKRKDLNRSRSQQQQKQIENTNDSTKRKINSDDNQNGSEIKENKMDAKKLKNKDENKKHQENSQIETKPFDQNADWPA